jgi:soluble lytic murein transglycosylase-like protein
MRICLYVICVTVALALSLSAGTVPTIDSVIRTDPRTGQFVRTVHVMSRVVPSRTIAPQTVGAEAPVSSTVISPAVRSLVEETAKHYEVSPELVDSVIQVESNYNPHAISPKGAQGLMQLMPATARRFGVKNTFDPKDNIEGGVRYLKFLQETFKDERLAIAAYNAGEGAVQKYGNVPPYQETMSYVANVGRKYGQARRAALKKQVAKQAADSQPQEPEHRPLAQFIDSEGRLHLTTQ